MVIFGIIRGLFEAATVDTCPPFDDASLENSSVVHEAGSAEHIMTNSRSVMHKIPAATKKT